MREITGEKRALSGKSVSPAVRQGNRLVFGNDLMNGPDAIRQRPAADAAAGRCEKRASSKRILIHNGATAKIEIDAETCAVTADGELLVCEPADKLRMAQRYFLF